MAQVQVEPMSNGEPSLAAASSPSLASPTGQAVTLRLRGGPNTLNSSVIEEFHRFWVGMSETLTLPNVEVVVPSEIVVESKSTMADTSYQGDPMDTELDYLARLNRNPDLPTFDFSQALTSAPEMMTGISSGASFVAPDLGWTSASVATLLSEQPQPSQPSPLPIPSSLQPPDDVSRQRRQLPSLSVVPPSAPETGSTPTRQTGEVDIPRTCLVCFETLDSPIFLNCGHSYCRPCVNRLVSSGIGNRLSWPPRCCTNGRGVDVSAIQNYLDEEVLIRYVSIAEEYSTRNPVYCANKFCSRHIEQKRIKSTKGRFVSCGQCDTLTCVQCKQSKHEHVGSDQSICKQMEALMHAEDRKLAKAKRWKQCPGCQNLVERIEGCDHVSCSCGVAFCYRCGGNRDMSRSTCTCGGLIDHPPVRRQRVARARASVAATIQRAGAISAASPNEPHRQEPASSIPPSATTTPLTAPSLTRPGQLGNLHPPSHASPSRVPRRNTLSRQAQSSASDSRGETARIEPGVTVFPVAPNQESSDASANKSSTKNRAILPRPFFPNSRPIFGLSGTTTNPTQPPSDRIWTRAQHNRFAATLATATGGQSSTVPRGAGYSTPTTTPNAYPPSMSPFTARSYVQPGSTTSVNVDPAMNQDHMREMPSLQRAGDLFVNPARS